MLGRRARMAAIAVLTLTPVVGIPVTSTAAQYTAAVHTAAVHTAAVGIDTTSRAAVRAAFTGQYRPALSTPVNWSGSTQDCRPGTPSKATQAATLEAINYFRAMGRMEPVTFSPALSAKAQTAALIMDAQSDLSHDPPSSWRCWTGGGADAAGHSNLCLGCSGAFAVEQYMTDDGDGNTAAGHRRWVMYPRTAKMGSGSTSGANALWVFGGTNAVSTTVPDWTPWPTPGYFPVSLEPQGRWSLSAGDDGSSFAQARVSVRQDGRKLATHTYPDQPGYGSQTLVFQVAGVRWPASSKASKVDVLVTNIRQGSATLRHSWTVDLFDPDAPLRRTGTPVLKREGQMLSISTGAWSPSATSYNYSWYRNSKPVAGATQAQYALTAHDAGQKISARVVAKRPGYAAGTYRSPSRTIEGASTVGR